MTFPRKPRVIYQKKPLAQVICQLRFPTILRIETELPAVFQDRIRSKYPLYVEKPNVGLIPPDIAEKFPAQILGLLQTNKTINAYEFSSSDQKWILSLTRDFLALTAREYERWEDFKEHLIEPIEALQTIYNPAFYSRVGLRYQNLIRRSKLGLNNVAWRELFNPFIAGLLASSEVSDTVEETSHLSVFSLPEFNTKVRLLHGLGIDDEDIEKEKGYVLDADLFSEPKIEVQNVFQLLDYFNEQNRHLFQWCISPRLNAAMEPKPTGG